MCVNREEDLLDQSLLLCVIHDLQMSMKSFLCRIFNEVGISAAKFLSSLVLFDVGFVDLVIFPWD